MLRYDSTPINDNGNHRGPYLACSHCHDALDSPSDIVLIGTDGELLLAHQGPCHDAKEAELTAQGRSGGWLHLRDALERALRNLTGGAEVLDLVARRNPDPPPYSTDMEAFDRRLSERPRVGQTARFEMHERMERARRVPEPAPPEEESLPF